MSGVVHFEIPADDQDRAREFYGAAFDWRLDVMPELQYTNVLTTPVDEQTQQPREPGAINGGMFERTGDLAHPIITVDVDDIDASVERGKAAGGSIALPKLPVPGIGWLAYLKDPDGNIFGMMQADTSAA